MEKELLGTVSLKSVGRLLGSMCLSEAQTIFARAGVGSQNQSPFRTRNSGRKPCTWTPVSVQPWPDQDWDDNHHVKGIGKRLDPWALMSISIPLVSEQLHPSGQCNIIPLVLLDKPT